MTSQQLIDRVRAKAKQTLTGAGSGHDWDHTYRVWQLAKYLAKEEQANLLVVELAAWLHDLARPTAKQDHALAGAKLARDFLQSLPVEPEVVEQVVNCIAKHSFSGRQPAVTLEEQVIQDADRLDALGAVGLARCFAYGETHQRSLTRSIDHIKEKLLLLKGLMNTKTGQQLACDRHQFVEQFLTQLQTEIAINL
ncbi:MAG: HD domain-containing protein [Candidatus Pacebacteria bacterium]|nr:HD domain-containing protein [Candidatus Paceibacterota bacterium]